MSENLPQPNQSNTTQSENSTVGHHEARTNNLAYYSRGVSFVGGTVFLGLAVYQAFSGNLIVSFEALVASGATLLSIGAFGKPQQ